MSMSGKNSRSFENKFEKNNDGTMIPFLQKKLHFYKNYNLKSTASTAASTAADDDFIVVETCTDPRGPNTVQRAAGIAADDDFNLASNYALIWYIEILEDCAIINNI